MQKMTRSEAIEKYRQLTTGAATGEPISNLVDRMKSAGLTDFDPDPVPTRGYKWAEKMLSLHLSGDLYIRDFDNGSNKWAIGDGWKRCFPELKSEFAMWLNALAAEVEKEATEKERDRIMYYVDGCTIHKSIYRLVDEINSGKPIQE